jgi:serine/threonine protein kinase
VAQGDVVGDRYHLLERLDAGGMGEVWKAGDERLGGKIVAVKRIPVDDGRAVTATDIDLFRREALAASQLRHRNAVAVTDFFVDSGAPFIVTEYVEGRTLSSLVRPGGLTAAEVAACDLWSLGATLFELLTGTSPSDGPTRTAIMAAILVQLPRRQWCPGHPHAGCPAPDRRPGAAAFAVSRGRSEALTPSRSWAPRSPSCARSSPV